MWPWELRTVWGHGLGHTFTVIEWYIKTYPIQFIASALAVFLVLAGLVIAAAIAARQFHREKDPARKQFGSLRSAKRKGLVK